VVPLGRDPLARSFSAQLAELHHGIQASWRPEAPEAGFTKWAAAQSGTRWDLDVPPVTVVKIPARRWSEAPILAAIGYRLATSGIGEEATGHWIDGMQRLMARDPVPADRNSFFFRPVELLGLATGASTLAGKTGTPARWLYELLETRQSLLPQSSIWNISLGALTARSLGLPWEPASRQDPRTPADTAILLWLHLIDESLATAVTSLDRTTLSQRLLEAASTTQLRPCHLSEQGIVSIALQRAVTEAVGDLKLGGTRAADFIVSLCRRFPLLAAELGNRHGNRPAIRISDEYDVQDLLRGLLRLHFDDVQPEEWNPSYGGVQSRSDLLLKPERIVIETKMTRKNLGQRDLVHQLIVDKAQYQTHPDCGTLICYVYDPDHRLANPAAVEREVSGQDGSLTTIVVISPRGF
jgi:REase_DpnII-MboI